MANDIALLDADDCIYFGELFRICKCPGEDPGPAVVEEPDSFDEPVFDDCPDIAAEPCDADCTCRRSGDFEDVSGCWLHDPRLRGEESY